MRDVPEDLKYGFVLAFGCSAVAMLLQRLTRGLKLK